MLGHTSYYHLGDKSSALGDWVVGFSLFQAGSHLLGGRFPWGGLVDAIDNPSTEDGDRLSFRCNFDVVLMRVESGFSFLVAMKLDLYSSVLKGIISVLATLNTAPETSHHVFRAWFSRVVRLSISLRCTMVWSTKSLHLIFSRALFSRIPVFAELLIAAASGSMPR